MPRAHCLVPTMLPTDLAITYELIRYDTIQEFNVDSKSE